MDRKVLSVMTYYTLVGIMVAFAVFFGIFLWTSTTTPLYAKLIYTILVAIMVGVTVLDIVSVNISGLRAVVGYILYCITVLNVIASFVIYGLFSTNGALVGADLSLFTILLALSYGINVLAIIIYAMGNTDQLKR